MNKGVKTALVFVGGFVAGGIVNTIKTKAMIYKYMLDNFECDEHHRFDNVIFETRGDAESVIDQLKDILDTYGFVTVADLYELSGMNYKHGDNHYGWIDLKTIRVLRVRNGWVLDLPRALPVD